MSFSVLFDTVENGKLSIEGHRIERFNQITNNDLPPPNNKNPNLSGPSSTFFVQAADIADEKNNKRIILKVVNMEKIFSYQAFCLGKLIVCPASLCVWFQLTDYSYLRVKGMRNFFECYYIFLKLSFDEFLSILSKNSLEFNHMFKFNPPFEDKILTLDSENKCVRYLLPEEIIDRRCF